MILKQKLLILFCLGILISIDIQSAYCQNYKSKKDSIYDAQFGRRRPIKALIKTSIFSPFTWQLPFTGEYRLLGEFMTTKNQSVQLGASYLTRSLFLVMLQNAPSNSGGDKISMNGYRVQAAYKFYLVNSKMRPEGIFIALHSSFATQRIHFKDYPDDYQTMTHFNVNLLIGGQFVIANRISMEGFMGPGYKNNSYGSYARPGYEVMNFSELFPTLKWNFKFNLGMNIGIAL